MDGVSAFEREREEQIERNNRLLQELGLHETLERIATNHRKRKQRRTQQRPLRKRVQRDRKQEPVRQSNRLKGKAAPSYDETKRHEAKTLPGSKKTAKKRLLFYSTEREVYTLEQYKSLGTFTKEWKMGVDGYVNGERVYSTDGLTCHQCRQKTLGKRSCCSECNSHYGVFCGDCLWARYGENVDELTENWRCPSCRGFCNCSICRNRNGWAATGQLYWKVKAEGYASAAHYIVSTHLEETPADEQNVEPNKPVAKEESAMKPDASTNKKDKKAAKKRESVASKKENRAVKKCESVRRSARLAKNF